MSSADPQGLQAFPEALQERTAWLEPFKWYGEMRTNAPVRYDSSRGAWDVFRYDNVKTVISDNEKFSVNPRNASDFEGLDGLSLADTSLSPTRSSFIYGVESLPIRYDTP